jgi:hypothetical protein
MVLTQGKGAGVPAIRSADTPARFLVLLGYFVWTGASFFFLVCSIGLAVAVISPDAIGADQGPGTLALLTVAAAALCFYCAGRLRGFARRFPLVRRRSDPA